MLAAFWSWNLFVAFIKLSGVLDIVLSLVRSIAWLKPFVRGFLTTEILFVGVHHLSTIRWSGIVGFAYQFLGVFWPKRKLFLVDASHIYGTWR